MSERNASSTSGVPTANQGRHATSARAGLALIVLIILGLSTFLALEVPRISQINAVHTDFIETVYGLRAFWSGADPYGNAVAAHVDALLAGHPVPSPPSGHYEHPFDYLLPPALLYSPFVALPDEAAIIAVRALTVALYLIAWLALVWRFAARLPAPLRALLLLLGLAWWPFLSVILPIVQQAGTVFALLVLAVLAAERGHWVWAGAAAFLALLKPTESALVVALLALFALRLPAARRPFLVGFLAVGAPTTLAAFVRRRNWVADWVRAVASLRAGHFGYVVDNLAAVSSVTHLPASLLYAAALLGCGLVLWQGWRAAAQLGLDDPRAGETLWWWIGLACLLTLLLIPRTGAYDVVIALIPWSVALGATGALRGSRYALATAALFVLLAGAGLLAYRDHAALELPLFSLLLLPALWLCRHWGRSPLVTAGAKEGAVPAAAGARSP